MYKQTNSRLPIILFATLLFVVNSVCAQEKYDSKELLEKAKSFRTTDHDSAMYYGEKALEFAKSKIDYNAQVEALHELGYNFRENSQYDEALTQILMAKKILMAHMDSTLYVLNDYMQGGIYFEKDNFPEAIKHYLSAIPRLEQLKLYDKHAFALNGIANVYSYAGKPAEALFYYEKALKAIEKTSNKRLPASTYNNIGNFYFHQKDYNKAETYLKKAEQLFIDAGLENDLTNIYFNYGYINRDRKKYPEAVYNFSKCVQLGKKYDLFEDQIFAYKELENIFKQQSNFEKAYAYADSFRVITEKIHTQNIEKTVSELETKFKLEEKNQLLIAKQQEILLDEKKIRAETTAIILLVCFLVLLIIFFVLVFYAWKKNKNKNHSLNRQNAEITKSKEKINKALSEKETLIKEIHHRVKNNLQVISSLLNLQVSSNSNEEVRKELTVAKDRIHAISLVHQKLYSENNFEKINIADYINDIVVQQKIALQKSVDIETFIEADSIRFNLNTSVPVGIILNELITNCFKYAFQDQTPGRIYISIHKEADHSYLLTVKDNGAGFPPGFDLKQLSSLGMEIILSLAEQIDGTVKCYNNGGACVEIRFKEIE
ncbi:MAG: signal transduction histidine kinase [Bacteroidetes bacterium]|jgi:two-component sensor histidine kinase/Flp pilus assembly protein TadD|nr:signal transduction histidine kinase [Bacteroidota bacterium]